MFEQASQARRPAAWLCRLTQPTQLLARQCVTASASEQLPPLERTSAFERQRGALERLPWARTRRNRNGNSATIWMRTRIASSRNAPERVEHCLTRMLPAPRQFVNRLHGFRRPTRRDANRLSCSINEPAFPSRPGAAQVTARSGGDWEERSHPQPRTARCCARAWRGWRAPDLPRSEHRGTLPPVEDRASTHPLRSVTSRNRCHTYCVSSVERCLPRYLSSGCRPKYHRVRQRMPPRFHPAL